MSLIMALKYGGSMYVVLIYDIKQIGEYQRIWRKVYKECKKYLYHVQNSVFEGELSKSQLFSLKTKLEKIFRTDLDSCIVFKSNNSKWMDKIYITEEQDDDSQFI